MTAMPPFLSHWAPGPFPTSQTQRTPSSHSSPPSKGFLCPVETYPNSTTRSPMFNPVWPRSASLASVWPPLLHCILSGRLSLRFSNTPQAIVPHLKALCLEHSSSLSACGQFPFILQVLSVTSPPPPCSSLPVYLVLSRLSYDDIFLSLLSICPVPHTRHSMAIVTETGLPRLCSRLLL